MNQPLFAFLLALTLVDLGFVQATDAVPATAMAPLWALALATPWLCRLQGRLWFRAAWNLGVLGVFALLVHDAASSGLAHLLEDGLALAALCQVHLVHHVGDRQRPDLLFFNSFLIAFVTSIFAPDLAWCGLFVAHAFAFVPALCLHAAPPVGPLAAPAAARNGVRDGVRLAAGALAATAILFVVVPRDFRREGWLGDALALARDLRDGLGETLRVDDDRAARLSERVVARIRPASGRAADVPAHWRGTAYASFDGVEWTMQAHVPANGALATDPMWRRDARGALVRAGADGPRRQFTITLLDGAAMRLPTPLHAARVATAGGEPTPCSPRSDGSLHLRPGAVGPGGLVCSVDTVEALPPPPFPASQRTQFAVPPVAASLVARQLADDLRARTADADPIARAAVAASWLQRNRRYVLPGQDGFARDLDAFLRGDGGGHCEYFATALALLLRLQGVPCRLVGGHLAHEWDAQAREVVVRGKHAHAWVEALDEAGAWRTFDPTPAAEVQADAAGDSLLARARAALQQAWSAVVGFNATTRAEWLAAFVGALRSPFAGALALGAALWLLARVRRRRAEPAVRLVRIARQAGLRFAPGETPRELLARATAAAPAPERLRQLADAVAAHEAARYAQPAR
jgi:transglutaminase-like putative cysteine protease